MKIFDYADLGKKRIWDYKGEETPEIDGINPIFETDKRTKIGEVLIIDGIAYAVVSMTFKEGTLGKILYCIVRKLENQLAFTSDTEVSDQDYEDEIICPYCENEMGESWEMPDEDDECECGDCFSTFSYQRDVTVTYSSQPVKRSEPRILSKQGGKQ